MQGQLRDVSERITRWEIELQESLNKSNSAIQTTSTEFPRIISDWRTQPAQFLVPWLKVDDLNIQQWLEKLHLEPRSE